MKYTYTDITTVEINMALSLGEIEDLIDYFFKVDDSDKTWVITRFEKALIQARKDTYNLIKIHADKEVENV